MAKLDYDEAKELAEFLLKIENPNDDYDTVENALCDKWNIDLGTFEEIANGIFKTLDFGLSPITNTAFVGFSTGNMWISKKEVDQQFIAGLIHWCTEGEEFPKNSKGFLKTITKNGKPEFEIVIRHPKNNI